MISGSVIFLLDERSITGFGGVPMQPGRLYALPLMTVFSVSLAGVSLGLARAAIDAFWELARSKKPMDSKRFLKAKPAVQSPVGRAEAALQAARAFLFEAVQALSDVAETGSPSLRHRALVRLAIAHVASSAKQVVDMMFGAGGRTSLYEYCRLARCWRDAHAAAQHTGVSPNNFETGSRVMLGMDPGMARF